MGTDDDGAGRAGRDASTDAEPADRRARSAESGSRVSVVDEQPPRPSPPPGASDDEYKWHTYKVYPSGRPDAVEFIDTLQVVRPRARSCAG